MSNRFAKCFSSLVMDSFKNDFELTTFITNSCNLRCEHCFYSKQIGSQSSELTTDFFQKLSLPDNCKRIIITGGEPFLRDDLLDVISVFKKKGVSEFNIVTNGILTEKISRFVDFLSEIKNIKFSILVSLDGPREIHDNIRKYEGAFDKALDTLKILQEKKVNLVVLTTISVHNYKALKCFDKYIQDNLQVKIHYQFIRGADISGLPDSFKNSFNPANEKLLPSEEDMKKMLVVMNEVYSQRIKETDDFFGSVFNFTVLESKYIVWRKKKNIFPCFAGKSRAVIYPSGEVGVCEYMNPVNKRLQDSEYNLNELLASKEASSQREIAKKCYCTHGCFVKIFGTIRFLLYSIKNMFRFLPVLVRIK